MSNDSLEHDQAEPSPAGRRRGRFGLALIVGGLGTLTALAWWWQSEPANVPAVEAGSIPIPATVEPSADLSTGHSLATSPSAEFPTPITPENFIGRWVLNEDIRRDCLIRPDGTATMRVDLNFLGSLFYGSQLTLQLRWSLHGNLMTHRITAGEPQKNVNRLVEDFGAERTYEIVRLNDTEMHLRDFDKARTIYAWKRVR